MRDRGEKQSRGVYSNDIRSARNNYWGRRENETSNRQNNSENARANVRSLQKAKETDFIEELCWDVQPDIEEMKTKLETRIVSSRIMIQIFNEKYPMLIDTGSEVTCIVEQFYVELKKDSQLSELPVSNVSIYAAVGSKVTTIKRQVQLAVRIGNEEVVFPFLVIPGLSSRVIAGTDWQDYFGMVIDYERKTIKFKGNELSRDEIFFHSRQAKNSIRLCNVVMLKRDLWYKNFENIEDGLEREIDIFDNDPNIINKKICKIDEVVEICVQEKIKMGDAFRDDIEFGQRN